MSLQGTRARHLTGAHACTLSRMRSIISLHPLWSTMLALMVGAAVSMLLFGSSDSAPRTLVAARNSHQWNRTCPETATQQPQFMVIGAETPGVEVVRALLRRHGSIAVPKCFPQCHFFDQYDKYAVLGPKWYLHQFQAGQSTVCGGDTTTATMYSDPDVVSERVREMNPDMKLVVVLQNPVHRFLHEYRLSSAPVEYDDIKSLVLSVQSIVANCEKNTTVSTSSCIYDHFVSASREYNDNGIENAQEGWTQSTFLLQGMYSEVLSTWIDKFGVDKLLFLLEEDISTHWHTACSELTRFLCIDESVCSHPAFQRSGAASFDVEIVPTDVFAWLHSFYLPYNKKLSDMTLLQTTWNADNSEYLLRRASLYEEAGILDDKTFDWHLDFVFEGLDAALHRNQIRLVLDVSPFSMMEAPALATSRLAFSESWAVMHVSYEGRLGLKRIEHHGYIGYAQRDFRQRLPIAAESVDFIHVAHPQHLVRAFHLLHSREVGRSSSLSSSYVDKTPREVFEIAIAAVFHDWMRVLRPGGYISVAGVFEEFVAVALDKITANLPLTLLRHHASHPGELEKAVWIWKKLEHSELPPATCSDSTVSADLQSIALGRQIDPHCHWKLERDDSALSQSGGGDANGTAKTIGSSRHTIRSLLYLSRNGTLPPEYHVGRGPHVLVIPTGNVTGLLEIKHRRMLGMFVSTDVHLPSVLSAVDYVVVELESSTGSSFKDTWNRMLAFAASVVRRGGYLEIVLEDVPPKKVAIDALVGSAFSTISGDSGSRTWVFSRNYDE